eukprot:CAMPEP_0170569910 /NCGR_PEP_ID=MMETSP0224-20130122/817_1 /TAXON_ID=285029 /ORGANISM="Togula jolla, Strain CCCM 725" /LENGTH=31 /DNA_ID= /DNA_START= /DNA_END= /DNA_ORIENTATION=
MARVSKILEWLPGSSPVSVSARATVTDINGY